VENVGNTEDSDVCGTDGVGKVLVVWKEDSVGSPVVCGVVEAEIVGDECVVNEVTVPLLVDWCVVVVLRAEED
jgi:hypothetical protein